MSSAKASMVINASVDEVWALVSDFNGLPKFARGVSDSTADGADVGAIRTLRFANGTVVQERLEKLDHAGHALCYSIVSPPVPFDHYRATIVVRPCSAGSCEVHWGSTFDPKEEPEEPLIENFQKSYAGALKGLKKYFES